MEPTFIEHMLPTTDVEMLPFQHFVQENVIDESMRIEPQPVGETPQEAPPPTIRPESAPLADMTMQEIQEPQENVERMMQELFQEPESPALTDNEGRMMQNLFQEPENAALTVSVVVGDTSFVHALPSHEEIEPEAVLQPEDNIAGRLRPATARRRRLVFEGSPPSPQQTRKRRIRQPREDDPAGADLGGQVSEAPLPLPQPDVLLPQPDVPLKPPPDAPLPPPDAPLPQPDAPLPQPDAPLPQPDDNFDDLGVIPLTELEPQFFNSN
ncbi:mitogen-activated protein kinase 7-like [Nilaparvata lugens]|uniref:mitogen-activated protein kinase 7-like n=1 Tax=Nilaparvata lugens TaxID=108931 RepID=UPI00193EBB62|nr:mitogen-activated protein kinase 7-like [Nilaparvata lugens]